MSRATRNLYMGLDRLCGATLAQVGTTYGVTRQRAHQVCMQELAKWGVRADEVNVYERTAKVTRTKTLTFLERIEAKLVTVGTHRLWLGATNNGSPVIMCSGRVGSVRRHLWTLFRSEPLPQHVTAGCGVPRCVALDHLEEFDTGAHMAALGRSGAGVRARAQKP